MKRLILIFAALFGLMPRAMAADGNTWIDHAALEAFLKEAADKGFIGVIGISDRDGTINTVAFGDAVAGKKPYTQDTILDIASVSKQFTGAAILQLREEGKLELDDPLSRFLPGVPADKAGITLHQLLTHTAEMVDLVGRDENPLTRDEFLKRAFKAELLSKPGERHAYSNTGYSLLAAVIEHVSGMSYEAYLRDHLWKPAGMFMTGYYLPDYTDRTFPRTENGVDGLHGADELLARCGGDIWNLYGNGGILSTAEDMLRWHRALMGNTILSAESKALLFTPHVPEDAEGVYHYGYGWSVVPDYKGKKLVWHNGGGYFTRSEFWHFPDDGTAFFLASHGGDVEPYKVAAGLAEILQGRAPKPIKP